MKKMDFGTEFFIKQIKLIKECFDQNDMENGMEIIRDSFIFWLILIYKALIQKNIKERKGFKAFFEALISFMDQTSTYML